MNAKLTLDKAGRIVLPKPVRDELNLLPGDTLELETSEDGITLHPVRATPVLQKERGVWVYRTGEKMSASVVEDTIRQIREERDRAALGQKS
jgi:AbrB family looped-hinge helix DNA binding protein